jgi:hypothetical protein
MRDKRYIKIDWEADYDDEPLPRILQLDANVDNDDDLKMVLQAKAHCTIKSITEFVPEQEYLILYIDIRHNQHLPMLMLVRTKNFCEKVGHNWTVLKSFGQHQESQLIFDKARSIGYDSIIREEDNRIYFQEFVKNCQGQINSVLELIAGIIQSFNYYCSEDLKKSEISKN